MNQSFKDLMALVALMLWPAIPLFWIPVHCVPRFFRRLGFLTYALPLITWLPLAFVTFGLRDVLLQYRIAMPAAVQIIGACLFILGALLQAWTLFLLTLPGIMGMPEVTASVPGRLRTTGPFSVVRHPTYLSHTLMLLGVFLMTGVTAVGIATAIDALAVNVMVIPLEERELLERFGKEYEKYRRKVPSRILPVRHIRSVRIVLLLVLLLLLALVLQDCRGRSSQAPPASISLALVAGGFSRPVGITNAGDGSGRLFIVEQGGLIRIIKDNAVLPAPFLDLSSRLNTGGAEQGLLGLAFPPGYGPGRPYLYTNYTGTGGIGDTVVSRFTTSTDPDAADPSSEQTVLMIVQPFTNHNGGQLAFGPDGYLYISMGDGGSGGDPFGNAQNPLSLLGKMLRIDVNVPAGYAVPPGNPFVGNGAYRPEIWALGLRNPWRFSFDRQTGDLFIADVGQNSYEEVNVQPAASGGGQNYGWNIMEGAHCYGAASCDRTGLVLPVREYSHAEGCSITGGFVHRGPLSPTLLGVYLYGDYCSGRIWGLTISGPAADSRLLLESGLRISTFGEDEAGNVYVADHAGGNIYRIISP